MKSFLLIATSLLLLSCSFLFDGGKIKELNEDEVKKDYCKKRGWDYDKMKRDVCVVIDQEFKHFASIGTFANDRGCMAEECFFGGEYGSLAFLTPKALEYYGWGNKDKRSKLALKWTERIIFVWESPIFDMPKGFTESEFSKPKVEETKGNVIVQLWIREPAGMLNQSDYRFVKVTYSNSGEIKSIENLKEKTIFPEDK